MEAVKSTRILSKPDIGLKDLNDPLQIALAQLHKCQLLLAEIDVFIGCYNARRHSRNAMQMRSLRSNVMSELKTLERLVNIAGDLNSKAVENKSNDHVINSDNASPEELTRDQRRLMHTLRSSNLPFQLAVWTIAKERCKDVIAFGKRIYWQDSAKPRTKDGKKSGGDSDSELDLKATNAGSKGKRRSIFVDIVAEGGQEWVKISTISQNRLIFEMTEKGWDWDNEDDDYDSENHTPRTILRNEEISDDDDELELIKVASDMAMIAKSRRVKYRHPRLRFLIPKIVEGEIREIDTIIKKIRYMGIQVECGFVLPDLYSSDNRDPNSITSDDLPIATLIPSPFDKFTETINVDCTLLLAIVSDLSHREHIDPYPSMHRAILKQLEIEKEHPLVVKDVWPAMLGRYLVCTKEAAERMREIVGSIGTDTEKERTALVMGDLTAKGWSRKQVLQGFQELSDHTVPEKWLLPIKVVESKTVIMEALRIGKLPWVAKKVAESLTDINQSVFLYGWSTGLTTVTSNRTVTKQIASKLEEGMVEDEEVDGPQIWVCDTARSLVAKDKNRKD